MKVLTADLALNYRQFLPLYSSISISISIVSTVYVSYFIILLSASLYVSKRGAY